LYEIALTSNYLILLQTPVKVVKSLMGGSISPNSTTSSSSGLSVSHSYGQEEGFSPASSESSGSTREQFRNNKKAWSIFKKPPRERRNSRDDFIEENIIFR